jgi:hypothetical protein
MIDLSLAGLVGAVIGTVIAALVYGPVVALAERGFRSWHEAAPAGERETLEQEISVLRRVVLLSDIIVFAGIGYWLGQAIGG